VDVVRDSLPLVDSDRALRQVRIDAALPDHPVWVLGDRQRLQQVVVNLLSNACKFNRPGGTVRVRWQEGTEVALAISDEGQGMKESELAQLFQAFKRFSPAPDVPGSGVGLMVVQMLVEQLRGRIEVTSSVGEGSCFTVHLPPG
jgi:signal transduction histidine kinase